MLAPRKTLWSTPDAVIDHVIQMKEFSTLSSKDRLCDIGCGDGRCLLRWAEAYSHKHQQQQQQSPSPENDDDVIGPQQDRTMAASFLGIDIDSSRIKEAQLALEVARKTGKIHNTVNVSFHCANALESFELFRDATIIFLYLIPRGLRIFKPILLQKSAQDQQQRPQRVHVVTYMAPLPDESPIRVETVSVPHQPSAAWPVYLYEISF